MARQLASLSEGLGRQIGLLIERRGTVTHVIVGDAKGLLIPPLEAYPLGRRPLRGLRLVHTHLKNEALTRDDLTDLALLRLDLVAAVGIKGGGPAGFYVAHLMPEGSEPSIQDISESDFFRFDMDFAAFIGSMEEEMSRRRVFDRGDLRERALIVHVSQLDRFEQEDSMDELRELASSSDILVLNSAIQRPRRINPKFLMGEERLKELVIDAMNRGVTLLVFDRELAPSQMRAIALLTELKVIDRTQLILDIFARRAHTSDGKVQVELAQLKHRLPMLVGRGTAMSRLTGGIGGRGPGEMKLEIDRRRVRDRIILLERKLKSLSKARKQRRHRRVRRGVPIVSIIGYTNAGKSTLLNSLTKSTTKVQDKLFATLDTASRRLRFPREREVVITDTVGFIRDLPKELVAAFKSTLEELEDADLLLHLADASNPRFERQIGAVENILDELGLSGKPRLLVLNKADRLPADEAENLSARYGAPAVSALEPSTFGPLLRAVERRLWDEKGRDVPLIAPA